MSNYVGHTQSHKEGQQDEFRKQIAEKNKMFVKKFPNITSKNVHLIDNSIHERIKTELKSQTPSKPGQIFVNNESTIWSAIECHKRGYASIYLLNFANAEKPGGDYLNGGNSQEGCLCRQTLLYPTLLGNEMYDKNIEIGPTSDYMILSKDVFVIRGDDNHFLGQNDQFKVNIISSAAFDNRKSNKDSYHIMEQRIEKIIRLAANDSLNCQGKSALILGAFGCGVLKNDPSEIATIFSRVLNDEKFKEYFDCVIFPMNNEYNNQDVFRSKLLA